MVYTRNRVHKSSLFTNTISADAGISVIPDNGQRDFGPKSMYL